MSQQNLTHAKRMRRDINKIEVLLLVTLLLIFPATIFGGDIWLSILFIWLIIIGIAVHNLTIYSEILRENEKYTN
jgi:energy-coupling factor transporter transmembrane protein EcfT